MLVLGRERLGSQYVEANMSEEASEEQDHPSTLAQLELRLPNEMVEKALRDFSPLKVHLVEPFENRRWIELDRPTEVELQAGRGIRVVTTGRFRFDLLHIPIAAHLDRVEFLVAPQILAKEGSYSAAFPIEILQADVRLFPSLVDEMIVAQVNEALTPRASKLLWCLSEALSAHFVMPERLEQISRLELSVEDSKVEVTESAVVVRVAYRLGVERHRPVLP